MAQGRKSTDHATAAPPFNTKTCQRGKYCDVTFTDHSPYPQQHTLSKICNRHSILYIVNKLREDRMTFGFFS